MRIILLNLFKNFKFTLPSEQLNRYTEEDRSFNTATLGPRNINNKVLSDASLALYINVKPRSESKL